MLQFMGSQRVGHDLATEQHLFIHWVDGRLGCFPLFGRNEYHCEHKSLCGQMFSLSWVCN